VRKLSESLPLEWAVGAPRWQFLRTEACHAVHDGRGHQVRPLHPAQPASAAVLLAAGRVSTWLAQIRPGGRAFRCGGVPAFSHRLPGDCRFADRDRAICHDLLSGGICPVRSVETGDGRTGYGNLHHAGRRTRCRRRRPGRACRTHPCAYRCRRFVLLRCRCAATWLPCELPVEADAGGVPRRNCPQPHHRPDRKINEY
jgi:hypothetical protein